MQSKQRGGVHNVEFWVEDVDPLDHAVQVLQRIQKQLLIEAQHIVEAQQRAYELVAQLCTAFRVELHKVRQCRSAQGLTYMAWRYSANEGMLWAFVTLCNCQQAHEQALGPGARASPAL